MIKTLTPYYVTTPFVSPLTGLTCTSYTLSIYVWDGAITNVPASASYVITKDNPTGSTSDSVVNIGRIINDFLDFTPQKTTGQALIDGNNQKWIKHVVTYTTTNTAEATTPQLITYDLIVKGYGYGLSGINPDTPDNLIMLDGGEYKVNRNGVFTLPIEQPVADFSTSTIDAVNESIAIYYQDTVLSVIGNDDLGFTPTSITSVNYSAFPANYGTVTISGSHLNFVAGSTINTSPQTFTYTITDALGYTDTATVTLTATALPVGTLLAVNDTVTASTDGTTIFSVLGNDALGIEPTTITSVVQTGITSGTIAITGAGTTLTFTPNGSVPASAETFTYTITDNLAVTDTATVTLTVEPVGRFLESIRRTPFATSITVTGIYADTLTSFSYSVGGGIIDVNRCVIESSLSSTNPSITVYTWDDTNLTCISI